MRFAHTMIRVEDLGQSVDFYTSKLGMELLRRFELPGADATLAFEERHGGRADLQPRRPLL